MIKMSVVLPVYNVAPYIEKCMDSILRQTFSEIEVICIDDGSTDGSGELLDSFAAADKRVRVIHCANSGPGNARNTGISLAKGEYLSLLDSDDYFAIDYLEKMYASAKKNDADIVIAQSFEFDTASGTVSDAEWMLKKELLPGSVFSPCEIAEHLFQFTYGWAWDKLFKRSFVEEYSLRFAELKNSEDLVFVFPALSAAKTISVVYNRLIFHRINRQSSVSNSRRANPTHPYFAMKEFEEFLLKHDKMEHFERSFKAWALGFLVWNAAEIGDYHTQRNFFENTQHKWIHEFKLDDGSMIRCGGVIYIKYLLIKYTNFSIFKIVVSAYKMVKKYMAHFHRSERTLPEEKKNEH